jgi:hypothetical protein
MWMQMCIIRRRRGSRRRRQNMIQRGRKRQTEKLEAKNEEKISSAQVAEVAGGGTPWN